MSHHYEESYVDTQKTIEVEAVVNGETKEVRQFSTGAIRDKNNNKENFIESFSWLALKCVAKYMGIKALKYGPGNWIKGIPPQEYLQSALRHFEKLISEWEYGISEEHDNHAAAIFFNIQGFIHEMEMIRLGKGKFEIPQCYKDLYPEYDNKPK